MQAGHREGLGCIPFGTLFINVSYNHFSALMPQAAGTGQPYSLSSACMMLLSLSQLWSHAQHVLLLLVGTHIK